MLLEIIGPKIESQSLNDNFGYLDDSISKGIFVNVKKLGAKGDGITDDTAAIQSVIETLRTTGGIIYFPPGRYKVSTSNVNHACLFIDFSNVTLCGAGNESSVIFTTNNAHVPIHFSTEQDLTIVPPGSVTPIENFEVYGLTVEGTGNYEYFALAKGRGILFRNAKNVSIHDNSVKGLSMIGICLEGGNGFFRVQNNIVKDCKYSAINYNGRCYQSIISGNICSGSNGTVNSCAIQVVGHCIVVNNTVYGDIANPELSGGILWGEGNFDGIGTIANNLVKHCRFGVYAIYHGSVNISGNTIINCTTIAGIITNTGIMEGFTIANSDNIIANNLLINCYPCAIDTSSKRVLITGNKIRKITAPLNPANNTEPDAIIEVTPQVGIRAIGEGTSIVGNDINGCVTAISGAMVEMGTIMDNSFSDCIIPFRLEGNNPFIYAVTADHLPERIQAYSNRFHMRLMSDSRPTTGYFPTGSEWRPSQPLPSSPVGAVVYLSAKTTTAIQATAGANTVTLTSASNWDAEATLTVAGFELDDGTWHWATITNVAGAVVTLGTAVPAGRNIPAGSKAYFNFWKNLANLA